MAAPKRHPIESTEQNPAAQTEPRAWIEIGPGPGQNEMLRERRVPGGRLMAVVHIVRGYSNKSLVEASNEIVVKDEITRAITFVPETPEEKERLYSTRGAPKPYSPTAF